VTWEVTDWVSIVDPDSDSVRVVRIVRLGDECGAGLGEFYAVIGDGLVPMLCGEPLEVGFVEGFSDDALVAQLFGPGWDGLTV